jgi:hypothetical protein
MRLLAEWGPPDQIDTTVGGLIGYVGIGRKPLPGRLTWLLPHPAQAVGPLPVRHE